MNKALVIIDMINDFVDRSRGTLVAPWGRDIVEPIGELIDEAIKADMWIVFVEDEHTNESPEITSGDWPEHGMKGSWGAETNIALLHKVKDYDKVIFTKKDGYNGFANPDLAESLKKNDIDELLITGLVQEVCILQTTMGAKREGFIPTVVVDATVPFKPFDGFVALRNMSTNGVAMTSVEQVKKEFGDKYGAGI